MSDQTTPWIIQQIAHAQAKNAIWFTDENILPYLHSLSSIANKPEIICNRWDLLPQLQSSGFSASFSDFDCSHLGENSQVRIYYRISKEKAVVHHLINQALRLLQPEGELVICGQKAEGIKTYIEKAGEVFGSKISATKFGNSYAGVLSKQQTFQQAILLDDNNYPALRIIGELHQLPIYSKPGIFGWNKIDEGSRLLIDHLPLALANAKFALRRLLDLGCGYGYLTLASQDLAFSQRILTDNNAAAVHLAKHNCAVHGIAADVIASDAGSTLQGPFDVILCNPPFHQGFSVEGDLTDKFLAAAARLLAKPGIAIFVVNRFIPLEQKAQHLFRHISSIVTTKGFKVLTLQHG